MLASMTDQVTLRYATASHRGLVRANNEDSLFAGSRLIAVADGVGGQAAGEVASELAIAALTPLYDQDVPDALVALRGAVESANEQIRAAAEADPQLTGMATTITAVLLSGTSLALAHAGDSRAYLARQGEVTQITRDDTYVQGLVDQGCITPEQAETHPQRSLVTRVLQGSPVEATYARLEVRPGDRYLLCSDGLPDAAPFDAIAGVLRTETDPEHCAARLVDLALAGGGPDNVSVVVADLLASNATGGLDENEEPAALPGQAR
jgi:PPM family protein phosphatase